MNTVPVGAVSLIAPRDLVIERLSVHLMMRYQLLMASLTDPARELSDIAKRLSEPSPEKGASYLAAKFKVGLWSTEFFKIVACIFERADQVEEILRRSQLDPETVESGLEDLRIFKAGFTSAALVNPWNAAGNGITAMRDHGVRLSYFQDTVRASVKYPKLTDDEIAEFIELIDAYIAQVQENEDEHLFVRQAIVDGLSAFRFQLKYIGWMGAAYALVAFREVMFVNDVSTNFYGQQSNPDAGAFLSGMRDIIRKFKAKVDEAKSYSDAATFLVDTYRFSSAVVTPLLVASQIRLLGHG